MWKQGEKQADETRGHAWVCMGVGWGVQVQMPQRQSTAAAMAGTHITLHTRSLWHKLSGCQLH